LPPQGGRKHPHQEFLQINTTNILFICGGAFDNLEDIIAKRVEEKSRIGFAGVREMAEAAPAHSDPMDKAERELLRVEREMRRKSRLLQEVTPDDLLKYGMIPEFVGRIPVVVSLESLDREMMKRILIEPKNALTKQFQRLFALDNVELVFTEDALDAAATEAFKRKTGARGLRTILEEALLDVMYEIPSHPEIKKCVVDADAVLGRRAPLLLTQADHVVPPSDLKETA
ncbi:MAG: AAA family ATPase, partial [Anaerolineae bacterium]